MQPVNSVVASAAQTILNAARNAHAANYESWRDICDEVQQSLQQFYDSAVADACRVQEDRAAAMPTEAKGTKVRTCRACGCTDVNACLNDGTGQPCHWVAEDLCSACGDESHGKRLRATRQG
jgi:hypothetical protein